MSEFECDGAALWYDELGDGELFIALHGGLGLDHTYFRPWLDPFGDDLRLVYLDLRANGRSEGDGVDLTMQQLADDVDALRAHLGADRTWLLGHSYGGFVALQYALSHADHLAGVVLCDTGSTAPSGDTMMAELQRLGAPADVMSEFGTPIDTTADLQRFFEATGPYYLPHAGPEAGRAMLADLIYRKSGADGGDRALTGWDVTDRLAEIAVPTLVMTGEDDFMFPAATAAALSEGITGARLAVIAEAGHLPFIEQPDQVLRAVRDFVQV